MNRAPSSDAPVSSARSSTSTDRFDPGISAALSTADVAVFETFVAPKYLAPFAELALSLLTPPAQDGDAVVAHIGCRTGYPERALIDRLGSMRLVGTDASAPALELARTKASAIPALSADYRLAESTAQLPLPAGVFTHALMLHPRARPATRRALIAEASKALVRGGELAIALPLRGSFVEVSDLLREFATKNDLKPVAMAIEAAAVVRPSPEALAEELEALGFVDVDVEFRTIGLPFPSGRALLDDPATRIVLLPEWRFHLGLDDAAGRAAMSYVREAIDRYWAEGGFELTVHVGAVRGRKA